MTSFIKPLSPRQSVHLKLRSLLVGFIISLSGLVASAGDSGFGPAPDGSFTVAVIPDTQLYRGRGTKSDPNSNEEVRNDIFAAITDWIVDHRGEQNIVFVSHVGDIVDKNEPAQWAVARQCMNRIHGLIPYGISVGNHDMVRSGDSSLFQSFFPESRFETFDWYGGSFHPDRPQPAVSGNNANSFQRFEAGKLRFLILHLECNAPDDVLAWANAVIKEHSDRRVIVTTHMDLGPRDRPQTSEGFISDPKGRMRWKKCHSDRGNTPEQMWDKCFQRHKNLFLICSGDQSRTQTMHMTAQGVHRNAVHSCLSDYSSDGSVRLYRFLPADNRVEAITYNVSGGHLTRRTRLVGDEKAHQFSFDYDMNQRNVGSEK